MRQRILKKFRSTEILWVMLMPSCWISLDCKEDFIIRKC